MSALHLTFDDGPDAALTPAVLETLGTHGATATFFVLGARVREHPLVLQQILERGHRVELHGDEHLDHRHVTSTALARDTGRAIRTLSDHGVTPAWWRLPWGRPGPSTPTLLHRTSLRVVGWDADTHDWRGDGWDAQPDVVCGTARDGGIVLLHDGFGPGATRQDGRNTIEIVSALVAAARDHGTPVRALADPTDLTASSFPVGPMPTTPLLEPAV